MSEPKLPRGGILLKPRFYSEIEAVMESEELAEVMRNAPRELLFYTHDLPTTPLQRRDDQVNGRNDPSLSERVRDDIGRLWTKFHSMWPISGGSDGYLMAIFYPWEIDDVKPQLGIYNYLSMTIQPLTIYEFMNMYEPSHHERLPDQLRRFLSPDPYSTSFEL